MAEKKPTGVSKIMMEPTSSGIPNCVSCSSLLIDWNANEIHSWFAFQTMTGENMASAITAEMYGYGFQNHLRESRSISNNRRATGQINAIVYFDRRPSPTAIPNPIHPERL